MAAFICGWLHTRQLGLGRGPRAWAGGLGAPAAFDDGLHTGAASSVRLTKQTCSILNCECDANMLMRVAAVGGAA